MKTFVAEQVAELLLAQELQPELALELHPALWFVEATGALAQAKAEEPWAEAARALFAAEQAAVFWEDELQRWAAEVSLRQELRRRERSERSMEAEELQPWAQALFVEREEHLWARKQGVVLRLEPLFQAEVAWWAPRDSPYPDRFDSRVCPLDPVRLRSRRSLAKVALQPVRPDGLQCQPRADATRADLGSCKRGRMVLVGSVLGEAADEERV